MKHPVKYAVVALLFGSILAASAVAQEQKMYSWTDENGVVHFSDVQPEGQPVQEQMIPREAAPVAPSPYPADSTDSGPSVADQRREEISRKNAEARANKAMKTAQCSAWEAELAQLEPNRRVFFTNDEGETERMDDVERTDRVAELKNQVAQNCK